MESGSTKRMLPLSLLTCIFQFGYPPTFFYERAMPWSLPPPKKNHNKNKNLKVQQILINYFGVQNQFNDQTKSNKITIW